MSDQLNQNTPPEEQPQQPQQPQQRRPLTEREKLEAAKRRELAFKRKQQMLRDATPEQRERMVDNAHKHYEARVQAKEKTTAPTGFAAKWDNYWYHYKAITIITAIVVALVAWIVYAFVTRERYDVELMLLTTAEYESSACDALEKELSELVPEDLNGDGKKNVSIEIFTYDLTVDPDQEQDYFQSMQTKFMNSFGYGENLVYLIDEDMYDYTKGLNVEYIDLSEYTDSDLVDGDRYYIENDSDFAQLAERKGLAFVMRELDNMKDGKKEKMIKRHAGELEFVKEVIAEP